MKKQNLFLLLFFFAVHGMLQAQDTLPKFTLKNAGNNRIIIGWTNNFTDIKQISIQRSYDSLTNYKTILTVPDPTTLQNGYVDTKAPNDSMFYRLYIMLDRGVFLFGNPKRPYKEKVTAVAIVKTNPTINPVRDPEKTDEVPVSDTIQMGDTFIVAKPFTGVRLEKFPDTDSVTAPKVNNKKTKPNAFTPSLYVYTFRDGYVRISLPGNEKPEKYTIKFFEDDGTFLFELKNMKERDFKIDKANFYHAGWFRFELYEDGKLIEKHKFNLEKDF
jgi:hypothetical protein